MKKQKYYYRIYGLNIKSGIKMDELTTLENNEDIDVVIEMGNRVPVVKSIKPKKEERKYMVVTAKDVAIYHLYNGEKIIINAKEEAPDEDIIAFLLGWVLGRILVQRNIIGLHAATVVIEGKGIILAGKSGTGKSTLTSRFIEEGYKYTNDEISTLKLDNDDILVNQSYCLRKLTKEAMEKLDYVNDDDLIPIRHNRFAINKKEEYLDEIIELGTLVEITVDDIEEVLFKEVFGSEKLNLFLSSIYGSNSVKKHGIDKEYFNMCMRIVRNIPMYKLVRPKDKLTVEKQMNFILDSVNLVSKSIY